MSATTPSENGDHVTWRELNLALSPLKSDLSDLKRDVRKLLNGQAEASAAVTARDEARDEARNSRRFRINVAVGVLGAVISGCLGTLIILVVTNYYH